MYYRNMTDINRKYTSHDDNDHGRKYNTPQQC